MTGFPTQAHHWGQRCSAHSAESNLKEGSHRAEHLWPCPIIFSRQTSRHAVAQRHPSDTNRENQNAQEVPNPFSLALAAQATHRLMPGGDTTTPGPEIPRLPSFQQRMRIHSCRCRAEGIGKPQRGPGGSQAIQRSSFQPAQGSALTSPTCQRRRCSQRAQWLLQWPHAAVFGSLQTNWAHLRMVNSEANG